MNRSVRDSDHMTSDDVPEGREIVRSQPRAMVSSESDLVVSVEALEQFMAVERKRNVRALSWVASILLLVILSVCALLLSIGGVILQDSRKATQWAKDVFDNTESTLKRHNLEVTTVSRDVKTVGEETRKVAQVVESEKKKYVQDKETLKEDLVRFSKWYNSKIQTATGDDMSVKQIRARIAELERNETERQQKFEEIEKWFEQQRGVPGEVMPVGAEPRVEPVAAQPVEPAAADRMEVVEYPDGSRYEGELRKDKKHGDGVYVFPNGDRYIGAFKDDLRWGNGTYEYSSGAVYSGNFIKGRRQGFGKYTYANGDVFEGEFKDGKMHGRGRYRYSDGSVIMGVWKDDVLVSQE